MANGYDSVIEAMRSIQTESDHWKLADRLLRVAPQGNNKPFADIIERAAAAGVRGQKMTRTTLRIYRDTAAYWPESKRVPNISFTAHRAAKVGIGSATEAASVLKGLSRQLGPENVTVAEVKKAIAAKTGAKMPAKKKGAKNTTTNMGRVLEDLKAGGSQMIAAIGTQQDTADLDALKVGLEKVQYHVQRQLTKASTKKGAVKAAPAPVKQASKTASPTKKAATGNGRTAGDIRGLK